MIVNIQKAKKTVSREGDGGLQPRLADETAAGQDSSVAHDFPSISCVARSMTQTKVGIKNLLS